MYKFHVPPDQPQVFILAMRNLPQWVTGTGRVVTKVLKYMLLGFDKVRNS